MAIDKAIDSVKLESDLTSIADAIRSKGGTSDELAFPAGFVSAIGAISAGGSVKIASGRIEFNEKIVVGNTLENAITIEHNLGVVPDLFLFSFANTAGYNSASHLRIFVAFSGEGAKNAQTISVEGASAALGSSQNGSSIMYSDSYFNEPLVDETRARVVGVDASTFVDKSWGNKNFSYYWLAIKYGVEND